MKLLVIRHAIAMDREDFHQPQPKDDALRPLTEEGIRKMRRNAKLLSECVAKVDVLASSPLKRARQTAEIVAEAFKISAISEVPALSPERHPREVLEWLHRLPGSARTVAVVGHDPHLSRMVSWMLTEQERPLLELKKGGACLLEFPYGVEAGQAQILWLLRPALIKNLVK